MNDSLTVTPPAIAHCAHVLAYKDHESCKPARVTIGAGGVRLLREISATEGTTPREYLDALIHFAGSMHLRPGSWEAQGFEFRYYDRRNPDAMADKWF